MRRAARLQKFNDESNNDYADLDCRRQELLAARRLCVRCGWPTIDTSLHAIEQTASMIIDMLPKHAGARARKAGVSIDELPPVMTRHYSAWNAGKRSSRSVRWYPLHPFHGIFVYCSPSTV